MPKYRLYWAYGSNLNIDHMAHRCPRAKIVDALVVRNLILRFRGVADVASKKSAKTQGGLWLITPTCECALDSYEGVAGGLYEKRYFNCSFEGEQQEVLYYKMLSRGIMPPSITYIETIIQGYEDFGLDVDELSRAVQHSWEHKNKTPMLKRRHIRKGRPQLVSEIIL